ncbi:hypothetical protein, partial [Roseicitreum antarcticum]
MTVPTIRLNYSSTGAAVTFGSTLDLFSTGVQNVSWDSEDSTLGQVAGILGVDASLNLDYNFDLDAFWELSIGQNQLDLWYDIFIAYDESTIIAEGDTYVLDTSRWFVQDMELSDIGTTNSGSAEVGLEYDILLDLNEAELNAWGGTVNFAPTDPIIDITDERIVLLGGSIDDGSIDFYGMFGELFSSEIYDTEGEYNISVLPGTSITWDFDEDLSVENIISGTEDLIGGNHDLTWQNFSFTQESEDNDNFIGLNFDLDAILQYFGILPPNPFHPNPLTGFFDYTLEGTLPVVGQIALAAELLDIDLNLGLELERIVSFEQSDSSLEILDNGIVVGSGAFGDSISFDPGIISGSSENFSIAISVSGTYTQSYGVSFNLIPIITAIRAELGWGRINNSLEENGNGELFSTVPEAFFNYSGFDVVEFLQALDLIESNELYSSGFIEVHTVETDITLTSDGTNDFTITAIDGTQELEAPPEIADVTNGTDASTGFSDTGIDVGDPDYEPDPLAGSQTFVLDEIARNTTIDGGSGTDTAWI